MKFTSIEDNYLTKESVPILIEKCCSFVEMNLIREKTLYSNLCNLTKSNQRNNKLIANKLLVDKQYELQLDQCSVTSDTIVFALNQFFSNYIQDFHLQVLIKACSKVFTVDQQTASNIIDGTVKSEELIVNEIDLKRFLQKQSYINPVFYSIIKRFCIHFNLLANYTYKNAMDVEYLTDFLLSYMFDLRTFIDKNSIFVMDKLMLKNRFNPDEVYVITQRLLKVLVIRMTEKCISLFGLKESYLKIQIEMIEKSIDLRMENLNLKNESSLLLTICYHGMDGEKSFQLNADSFYTVGQALEKAKLEFGFVDSKYLSLFEVCSGNQCILERALPVTGILVNSLSRWSSFHLSIKYNLIEVELENRVSDPMLNDFYEECEVQLLCKNCREGLTKVNNCNFGQHRKWKKCYISVQNNSIKIIK